MWKAWSSMRLVASVPYPAPHASFSPIVMWNSAEPLSLSSWDSAHVPISRSVSRRWIAIASESVPRARAAKNRSISSRRMGLSW